MFSKLKILNNNQLKIIAIISMFLDHTEKILGIGYPLLNVIGRIAFPIFAYMIAEGCTYTKNRKRYFLTILLLAFAFQIVYSLLSGSLYMNILFTFSLSIALIYCIDLYRNKKTVFNLLIAIFVFLTVVFITFFLPRILSNTDFRIDYGTFGVLLPVAVYFCPDKTLKLISTTLILSIMAIISFKLKWFALLAVPLLAMYNGKRGKYNLKYMFYIFYPAHFVLLYLIDMFI